jgi:hypothetical protein
VERKFRAKLTTQCSTHGGHQVRLYSTNECLCLLLADRLKSILTDEGHACFLETQYLAEDNCWHDISIEDAIADDEAHGVS